MNVSRLNRGIIGDNNQNAFLKRPSHPSGVAHLQGGVAVWIAVAFSYIAALFSEIPRIVLCCNMVSACAGFSAVAMWDALRTDAEEHVDGYSTHG